MFNRGVLGLQIGVTFLLICFSEGRFKSMETGSCPKLPPQLGFSVKKLENIWYPVMTIAGQYASCQQFNITASSVSTLDIALKQTFTPTQSIEFGAKCISPDDSNLGFFQWSWNSAPLVKEEFTILDTDYENYAVTFSCHDFGVFHRKDFTVFSTDPNSLSEELDGRARAVLSKFSTNYDLSMYVRNIRRCPFTSVETKDIKFDGFLQKLVNKIMTPQGPNSASEAFSSIVAMV